MARRPKFEVICDRCGEPFGALETAGDTAQQRHPVSRSTGVFIDARDLGLGEVVYGDLCPPCKGRVSDLIRLIKSWEESDEEAPPDQESTRCPETQDGLTGGTMKEVFSAAPPLEEDEDTEREEREEHEEDKEDEHDE